MRFENSELRAFRAVVEHGGFKRAADALHISQSAVSQSVANLEAKLDIPLLLRGKQPQLTEAGKRMFDHAVEVLREEQQTVEDIAQLRQGKTNTLNLAMGSSINRYHGPALISAYCEQSPRIRLKIAEMPSRNIIYAVLGGSVELGLGPFQKHMAAFTTVPLYKDSRHLVVGPKHPQYEAMIRGDAKALKQTPLIASALDSPDMRPSIARIRDQFSTVWEVSSMALRIHMVSEGMGVTFLDQQSLAEHPQCRELSILDDVSFGRIDRQVGLYYRAGRQLGEGSQLFIDLCQRYWKL